MLNNKIMLRLDIFDGAASGEGAGEGAAAPDTKGQFDNVVFGKQPETEPAKEGNEPATEPRDFDAEFSDLIKGDYKDAYKKAIQKALDKRIAKHKETENKLRSAESALGVLAEKYGEYNVEKLAERINNDSSLFEKEAYENGSSAEQELEIRRMRAIINSQNAAQRRMEAEMNANNQYAQWVEQAKELQTKFPEFNLETEAQNEAFVKLLENNIPMEHAYFVIHKDEIMNNAVQEAMQKSAKATAQNIAARGSRPAENGARANTALVYQNDVSKLTPQMREEIARRVARGEIISF